MKNDEPPPERKKLRSKWLETNADLATRSNKNERRLAKRLGGKRVAGSGNRLWSGRQRGESARTATDGSKGVALHRKGAAVTEGGDVAIREFYIENKRTVKKSMSVEREWLRGIKESARQKGKDPALVLTFEDGRKDPEDWVAVPIAVFERLRDKDR